MTLALDLGRKHIPVLVLDDHDGVGLGSRAICFAKRTLDICDRLDCGSTMLDKGVVWNLGRVFYGENEVFTFNLSPQGGQRNPAFINLQQPYFEKFLHEQIVREQENGKPIEIRGCNAVVNVQQYDDYTELLVETPDGQYQVHADWLVACDGARSPVRTMLNLDFEGRVFEDNFLIADVRMTAPFPTERWFWFEPPFKDAGQSALLHKQPDDIWRIDFQLGWDIDREVELQPENVRTRVDAMLGDDVDYELNWTSIYTFQCRRMKRFCHGRVFFAGDSAHQVSPFGARGANSGVQDADNLAWKLALVINDQAPESLLDSYGEEREFGADENILNSTRATDFLTPKSKISKVFRNAVLALAQQYEFARPLVNSGRLSVPCVYDGLSLTGDDHLDGPPLTRAGAACPDAPLGNGFLLEYLGDDFVLLAINQVAPEQLNINGVELRTVTINTSDDSEGLMAQRYLGNSQTAIYLIRPDQHIAARWQVFEFQAVERALLKAIAHPGH